MFKIKIFVVNFFFLIFDYKIGQLPLPLPKTMFLKENFYLLNTEH